MSKSIPPAPPGWNKTIENLLAEVQRGERCTVGSPEVDWARDYERKCIPFGMRFPRKGDVYEAIEDINVHYMTAWEAPYTGDGEGTIKVGDRVLVHYEPIYREPVVVHAKALDYADMEERMVPAAVRADTKYSGFYFCLKTSDLNRMFKLVHEESE